MKDGGEKICDYDISPLGGSGYPFKDIGLENFQLLFTDVVAFGVGTGNVYGDGIKVECRGVFRPQCNGCYGENGSAAANIGYCPRGCLVFFGKVADGSKASGGCGVVPLYRKPFQPEWRG